jgi:quercetin dioxygenase-like cupin family protein
MFRSLFKNPSPPNISQDPNAITSMSPWGSVCLTEADTGEAYCLLEVSLAPGIGVPRHIHTREDETYYVTSGELEVIVGEEVFVLKAGDTLMAPRDIPHELRNSGDTTNHYLLVFSPSGFEKFVMATALPVPLRSLSERVW